MTENEIIECLKENKKKGIGYNFLPEEVQKWIYENFYKKILVYFNYQGEWVSIDKTNLINTSNYQNHIFSLSEDFELKKEFEGKWVEFEIDKNGQFTVEFIEGSLTYYYDWFNWWKLLEKSKDYEYSFSAFGGWQYDDGSKVCKTWHMQPMVFSEVENKLVNLCLCDEQEKTKPVIPIKIRFWRISK